MKKTGILVAVAGIMTLAFSAPALAVNEMPSCTEGTVLKKVVKRFNHAEKVYWRERGLSLSSVSNPHRHPHSTYQESPIERTYCHGTAHFEDGSRRKIHYLIENGAGFAGFGWNVEYCVHGLDPWKYYDGRCRVLSPGE